MSSRTEQACLWIVRLDAGDMDIEERQRLREWLQEDAENRRVFRRVRALWADYDHLGADIRGDSELLPKEFADLVREQFAEEE